MNKKGFITDTLVDAWAFITYILIVVIFVVIFSFGKGEMLVQIREDSGNMDYYIVLRDFLRTPYEDGTIADLISKMDMNDRSEASQKFFELAKDFFNRQFDDKGAELEGTIFPTTIIKGEWALSIRDSSSNKNIKLSSSGLSTFVASLAGMTKSDVLLASQIIPGYHNKDYIVTLYKENIESTPKLV